MSESSRGDGQHLVHDIAALERTALSWERTAVGLGAVGALLLKAGGGGRPLDVAGLLMLASAFAVVLVMVPLGYRRARSNLVRDRGAPGFLTGDPWRPRVMLATAGVTSLTALLVAFDAW